MDSVQNARMAFIYLNIIIKTIYHYSVQFTIINYFKHFRTIFESETSDQRKNAQN